MRPATSTRAHIYARFPSNLSLSPASPFPLSRSVRLSLPSSLCTGGVPRMCVEAKARHGGVGYQTRSRLPSAGFLSLSLSVFFSSVHIFLLFPLFPPPSVLYLSDYLTFFSFSFPTSAQSSLPLLLLLLLLPPSRQPSWAMRNVIERIQNNNKLSSPPPLTFHLSSVLRVLQSACPRRCVARVQTGRFRGVVPLHSAIFLRIPARRSLICCAASRDVSIETAFAT